MTPNMNYKRVKDSYLFFNIAQKTKAYLAEHPEQTLYRMGIGDVSLPLTDAVITALHKAVDDQAHAETFQGYMPECGAEFLRETIAGYYAKRGVTVDADEVFVSSGASDELGDILNIFAAEQRVMILEPAYPAYVDANLMKCNEIIRMDASKENGFLPMPDRSKTADIIYICSPNNPTGAVFNKAQLTEWVAYANEIGAVMIFDAAYEAFIEDPTLPHSIFEIEGARSCAVEICSLSKTAGFTGTRCGYTIIPKELTRGGMNLHDMWVRNRTTTTNGISYILQRGAQAVFSDEGQQQVKELIAVYKRNAKVLMEALDECGIWYCGGINAPYIWLQAPDGMDSWAFFDKLLHEIQVVGTPGAGFGPCGEGYFRFSTFGDPEATRIAAERIKALFKK